MYSASLLVKTSHMWPLSVKNDRVWQRNALNGIGGKIESADPTPHDAMVREFQEETGYKTKPEDWNLYSILRNSQFTLNVFTTTCDLKQLRTVTDEQVEIHQVGLVPDSELIPNLLWLIPLALDSKVQIAHITEKAGRL